MSLASDITLTPGGSVVDSDRNRITCTAGPGSAPAPAPAKTAQDFLDLNQEALFREGMKGIGSCRILTGNYVNQYSLSTGAYNEMSVWQSAENTTNALRRALRAGRCL